jgi:putative transposase
VSTVFDPFSFLVFSIAGWMNQHQQHVVQYLVEENRVLREQIGNRRMRSNDDQRRRVEVAGIASNVDGLWMVQIARNVTDGVEGFLKDKRYLIHDRDPLYTKQFLSMLAETGIESVKLPARSPNLNAYAERFVRTIKECCLDQMILFGEDSLRTAIREFLAHYHVERNHQGLGNRLIIPIETKAETGPVARRQRLGGLLNYYYREAA